MIPTTIFLDLDDVLNDFTLCALHEVGCPIRAYEYEKYDPAWKFDIVKAANALCPDLVFNEWTFWHSLDNYFWENIPESVEFNMLLEQCEKLVGREEIFILTSAPAKVGARVATAKIEWIYKFLPTWLHQQYFIGPQKHPCARPDALLIDDSDANVNAFRKKGGQAILVPRPWNKLHERSAREHLQDEFYNLFHFPIELRTVNKK